MAVAEREGTGTIRGVASQVQDLRRLQTIPETLQKEQLRKPERNRQRDPANDVAEIANQHSWGAMQQHGGIRPEPLDLREQR